MNETINKILYECYDKWGLRNENRDFFKSFLERFISENPDSEQMLNYIVEYGKDEDRLIIMKGVVSILKQKFPDTYRSVTCYFYADNRKKKEFQRLLDEK